MEQQVFLIGIDYRGHHSKGMAICDVIENNLQQKHLDKRFKIFS
jgi:hypothetical protein